VSDDNVAAVRRYVDAFNRLDLDAATVGLDPAIELREWPEAPGLAAAGLTEQDIRQEAT
jgi:hypothetical protein